MAVKKGKKFLRKSGRPQKTEKLNTKADLIRKGSEMLKECSLEDFSLRKVATLAGVSHAALYHHFENKNDLLIAISGKGNELFFTMYQEEINKTETGFFAQYKALGLTYVLFVMRYPEFARLMFGGKMEKTKNLKNLKILSRKTYKLLHQTIQTGQSLGMIQKGNTREKTLASWAMIHGVAMLIMEERLYPGKKENEIREFVHKIIEYAFSGMAIHTNYKTD